MTTRSEITVEAWCWRLWQTHPARRRGMAPHYWFPTREDFHRRWPLLARELIVADWQIEGALAGVAGELDVEVLDPPARQHEDWRRLYADELAEHPAILKDLVDENPVGAVARRARVTPAELDAFRLWAAGDSERSIARAIGRRPGTVHELLVRARFRLRSLCGAWHISVGEDDAA